MWIIITRKIFKGQARNVHYGIKRHLQVPDHENDSLINSTRQLYAAKCVYLQKYANKHMLIVRDKASDKIQNMQ